MNSKSLKDKIKQSNGFHLLINTINQRLECHRGNSFIIAIDGHIGSGKSTISELLKEHYKGNLFHMDDFYLPLPMRSKERFSIPGGNIHSERLLEEVFIPIKNSLPVCYRPFNPQTKEIERGVELAFSKINIVEGSYSLQQGLYDHYDFRILMSVSSEEQLNRIERREVADKVLEFKEQWIPLEKRYFQTVNLEAVDLKINTTAWLDSPITLHH